METQILKTPVVAVAVVASRQSGGTFVHNAAYALVIPESVYAELHRCSVCYTVA